MPHLVHEWHASALINGTAYPLHIIEAETTLDLSWSPYAAATLSILPMRSGVYDTLDHERGDRIILTQISHSRYSIPTSTLTAEWQGKPTSALTAAFGSKPASAFSDTYTSNIAPDDMATDPRPAERVYTLNIRSYQESAAGFTAQVTATGGEDRAQDFVQTAAVGWAAKLAPVTIFARVALARLGEVFGETSAGQGKTLAEATSWEIGEDLWKYLEPPVQAAGLRIVCDESGMWILADPESPPPGFFEIGPDNLIDADHTITRDGEWYNQVHITYRWTDADDIDHTRYAVASAGSGPRRTLALTYLSPWPGNGQAEAILLRARNRKQQIHAQITPDYNITPGQRGRFTSASRTRLFSIRSITTRFPDLVQTVALDILDV